MRANDGTRTGAEVLIDQLVLHGVRHVFCVPGESYIAALDALHDRPISVTVCRPEGGAAMMAEAVGKATGRPGVCFVTRGPGATNAAPGVHIAQQDSSPMLLFIGQVGRDMREREAFQEVDFRAMFGRMAKWATEIDDAARVPEFVSRAFHVATTGRPGPVVIALPQDMLTERSEEHTSELQSRENLVCRLLLEKKKKSGFWWQNEKEKNEKGSDGCRIESQGAVVSRRG